MGFSGPYPILIKKRPLGTLAGLNVLLSLIVHLLLILATQLALWYYIKTRPWLVVSVILFCMAQIVNTLMKLLYPCLWRRKLLMYEQLRLCDHKIHSS